jgi:ATP-binding cassette subfamily B protein/subfamily B ATP-binding cassette protein MsbA
MPRLSLAWHEYAVMLRYARPQAAGWLAMLVLTLLATGIALLVPLPLKVLIDNVVGHHPVPAYLQVLPGAGKRADLLIYVVVAELAFFAAASALDTALAFLWVKVGQRMVYDLSRDLFARVQRMSLRDHARRPVGETLQRVAEDSWAVDTFADLTLFTPLKTVVTLAGVILIMLELSPGLTAVACGVAPLMALASYLYRKPVRRAGTRRRELQGRLQSHVQQTLAGIGVVQAFGAERRQHARFAELTNATVRSELAVTVASGVNELWSGGIAVVGLGIILLVGAHQVIAGALTVGGLAAFVAYVKRLQAQLTTVTEAYTTLQAARASIERVVEVLDAPFEVVDAPGAVRLGRVAGHVVLEGVWFGYEPGRSVLRGVSLEARPGEVVAVVGATGAGKSTLASLVPRFFDPDRGRVLLDGHDVRGLELEQVRASVGLVLQESFLFPFSVAENIAFARPGSSREQIEAAARAANAHEFILRLPQGYETVVGERGATLSGGERQRIAIARALLKDAPVLILDEPTSALDAETEASVLDALERLMAGRTTIIIAHRLSTIRRAERIVVLDHGRPVEAGTHHQLLHQHGHYARINRLKGGALAPETRSAHG